MKGTGRDLMSGTGNIEIWLKALRKTRKMYSVLSRQMLDPRSHQLYSGNVTHLTMTFG